jgi:hypothetical protein
LKSSDKTWFGMHLEQREGVVRFGREQFKMGESSHCPVSFGKYDSWQTEQVVLLLAIRHLSIENWMHWF